MTPTRTREVERRLLAGDVGDRAAFAASARQISLGMVKGEGKLRARQRNWLLALLLVLSLVLGACASSDTTDTTASGSSTTEGGSDTTGGGGEAPSDDTLVPPIRFLGPTAAYEEATSGADTVLLNFSGVEYINSTGIALIVGVLASARKNGHSVTACGLADHYREIFEITRLSDFMQIFPDEASAVGDVVPETTGR